MTESNHRYFDLGVFDHFVQPQYKNFCGICSLITVVNSLYKTQYCQDSIHEEFKAGYYTKRKVAASALPASEDLSLVDFKGMSNFDIIRLFNSVSDKQGVKGYSALLTGDQFQACATSENIAQWLSKPNNYMIYHKVGHYMAVAGYVFSDTGKYWIVADSKRKGDIRPIKTVLHSEVEELAAESEKYGFILLSSDPIDFLASYKDNEQVFPIESVQHVQVS